ncbi:MAG: hypothetical protein HFJ37_01715 [Clostridia bacterium]|nr:hypothetical protein [Clostridia bacterium]
MYDNLIDWEAEKKPTIKDSMNPQLRKEIEQIIQNNAPNHQEHIKVIKQCIYCDARNQKRAERLILKLILVTESMGIDISSYYPKEYKKYLEIRSNIEKQKQQAKEENEEQGR